MSRHPSRSAEATREKILDAAIEVLAARGYDAANVDEIVRRCGASKGAFYFHFPSKEEMVLGLANRLGDRLVRKVGETIEPLAPSRERLGRAVTALLETLTRKRALAQLLLVNIVGHGRAMDRKFLPVRKKFETFIRGELDLALEAGALRPGVSTEVAARLWLGALHELILHWLLEERPEPLTSRAEELKRLLLEGVARPGEGGGDLHEA